METIAIICCIVSLVNLQGPNPCRECSDFWLTVGFCLGMMIFGWEAGKFFYWLYPKVADAVQQFLQFADYNHN